ncbi:uncharacterized protein LOC131597580 [Vicia villosa]|uniref:uncharacterized protein LOC131597580 n=1 Tax=Vicia villosa TaxID=3911 RepID=UPI00273CB420|nr:uncharacterized protein LOC131597580 [Vicia villosa]
MLRAIFKERDTVREMPEWKDMKDIGMFRKKRIYNGLLTNIQPVEWRYLMYDNEARPRAVFTMWLACHGRLATKARLMKFGMLDNKDCMFCATEEDLNHLRFDCSVTRDIWRTVLRWQQLDHNPLDWEQELKWIVHNCKGKSWKQRLLKTAFAETIYACWIYRNAIVYNTHDRDKERYRNILREIIDIVVNRVSRKPNLRERVIPLLL